ncbi:MAG: hypothetical protein IKW64_02945 [Clostridia bacterium]|nr:hypothetical protein [Clostridia bacterium]
MKIPQTLKKIFEIPLGKHLRINIWLIFVIVCSVLGKYWDMFVFAYISAALHELTHILCARALGVSVSNVTLYPFGISARLESGYIRSSEKEFLIALSGPAFSMAMFWTCTALSRFQTDINLKFIADTNLAICIINLIPALPLDGGRIFKAVLTSRYGIIRAYNLILKFSKVAIICLFAVALIIFFVCHFNFSLILISAFLLQNLCCEQQAVTVITLKEILANSQKAEISGDLPVKAVCVNEGRPASGILKHLSYDCFYIVHVLDKSSHIVKTLTETQVIDALTKYGIRVKYSDI